jgi:hypothetical protein
MTVTQHFTHADDLIAIWWQYAQSFLSPEAEQPGPMCKALVADEHAMRMITVACPMNLLMEYRVYDVHSLEALLERSHRTSLTGEETVCLLTAWLGSAPSFTWTDTISRTEPTMQQIHVWLFLSKVPARPARRNTQFRAGVRPAAPNTTESRPPSVAHQAQPVQGLSHRYSPMPGHQQLDAPALRTEVPAIRRAQRTRMKPTMSVASLWCPVVFTVHTVGYAPAAHASDWTCTTPSRATTVSTTHIGCCLQRSRTEAMMRRSSASRCTTRSRATAAPKYAL